jgi:hypothetical protein
VDGGFDGFEISRAVDEFFVARGVSLCEGFGEDGGVFMGGHFVHERLACSGEVAVRDDLVGILGDGWAWEGRCDGGTVVEVGGIESIALPLAG